MKREELQARTDELEAKDSLTSEEKTELKQKRQDLKKLNGREPDRDPARRSDPPLCSHDAARLEHRFCPSCGEALPALPRAAIEQIVEQALIDRGVVQDGQPGGGNGRNGNRAKVAKEHAELVKAAVFKKSDWHGHDGKLRVDGQPRGDVVNAATYADDFTDEERATLRKAHEKELQKVREGAGQRT